MDILDLHTHTIFSDGDSTVEEILAVAKKKGYIVGISDHVFCSKMTTMKSIENYFEVLFNVFYDIK